METIIYMIVTLLFFGGLSFTAYLTDQLKKSERENDKLYITKLDYEGEIVKLNAIINKLTKELSKLGFYIDGKGVLRRTKKEK